ncbi:MAG: TSUP family transporter [Reyranellaceae bacterium]
MPGLMLARMDLREAAGGASLVAVAAFGAASAASYAWSGLVDWRVAALLVAGGAARAWAGARLAAALAPRKALLGRLFAGFVIVAGALHRGARRWSMLQGLIPGRPDCLPPCGESGMSRWRTPSGRRASSTALAAAAGAPLVGELADYAEAQEVVGRGGGDGLDGDRRRVVGPRQRRDPSKVPVSNWPVSSSYNASSSKALPSPCTVPPWICPATSRRTRR